MLDDEQNVQAAQEHGIDMEEVGRQDRLRLGVQERSPGEPRPRGHRVKAGVLEDPPDRRRRDLMAQADQLTVDAPYPQPGLSRAISSTSLRMAGAVRGRPGARRG